MNGNITIPNKERYCTIEESIRESFKEIKLMREGKKPKKSIDDLWIKIAKWSEDV